jgi:hypothetical protein
MLQLLKLDIGGRWCARSGVQERWWYDGSGSEDAMVGLWSLAKKPVRRHEERRKAATDCSLVSASRSMVSTQTSIGKEPCLCLPHVYGIKEDAVIAANLGRLTASSCFAD